MLSGRTQAVNHLPDQPWDPMIDYQMMSRFVRGFSSLLHADKPVADSWEIATYLEDHFPDRPSLFGGEGGRAAIRMINAWGDTAIVGGIFPLIAADIPGKVRASANHLRARSYTGATCPKPRRRILEAPTPAPWSPVSLCWS